MEVVNNIGLIEPLSVTAPTRMSTLPVNFQKGINTINYKMQQKQLTSKRPNSKFSSASQVTNSVVLDTYLEDAKQKHLTKASWKTLDMTFKWQYLQEYVDANLSIEQKLKPKIKSFLKAELISNRLKAVEYNNKTKSISAVGIVFKDSNRNVEVSL
jgi:hypothetical protein